MSEQMRKHVGNPHCYWGLQIPFNYFVHLSGSITGDLISGLSPTRVPELDECIISSRNKLVLVEGRPRNARHPRGV